MAAATAGRRPRLSDEFLRANDRERVLAGTAKAIAEGGYFATTVTDIVRVTRTARNTFYRCFGGKGQAAMAVVADVVTLRAGDLAPPSSLPVLAIELASLFRDGRAGEARVAVAEAQGVLEGLAGCEIVPLPPQDDPRQRLLPPGRHTLSQAFISENHITRLRSAAAVVVARDGYQGTTVGGICREAAVSRRTFYDYFPSVEQLVVAMATQHISEEGAGFFSGAVCPYPRSGLGAVSVEVVAERVAGQGDSPLAEAALAVLRRMDEAVGG